MADRVPADGATLGMSRRGVLRSGAVLVTAASVTRALAAQTPSPGDAMMASGQIGYVLSHEQFPVPQLVEFAVEAEQEGFDAVWAS
ncbi:MAG TPA: hypothetical protein VHT71_26925, partial [Methylomirabilota bacterium]|nr:hypothetical protein [Methylomirabilota bacterium]